MDAIQQGIISLLKSAITGEKLVLPDNFDIDKAYPRIKAHHMASLAYAGAVNCGIDPQKAAMQQLFQNYCKALQISERQMRELERVFAAFDAAGIDYLPLKGCVMKAMYPRPELRMMGDADVLIRVDQYDRIAPIMRELGFPEGEETEQDFIWKSDSLYLELHKCLIAPRYEKYHAYFEDVWSLAEVQSGTRYKMSAENNFIFLFTHFSKHYSMAGVGCRHVVDLWVYLRNHPNMDEAYLRQELEKLKLWEFCQNIRRMIAVWFEGKEPDEKSDFITQFIFANGSWGSDKNWTLARGVKDMGNEGSAFQSRVKFVWRCIFPRIQDMRARHPILKKYPWMLPAVWLVRLVGKLASLRTIWRRNIKRLRLLNKDQLENRKNIMKYVGLDGEE